MKDTYFIYITGLKRVEQRAFEEPELSTLRALETVNNWNRIAAQYAANNNIPVRYVYWII